MSFWPKKQNISDIMISSLWSLLSGIIWSIIIVVITFLLSNSLDIVSTFQSSNIWIKTSSIFPLVLSIITLLWTTITSFLTYLILNMTAPEKYKKNIVIFWQLAFFQLLTYIFITPVYIYTGVMNYDNIMIVYLFHILTIVFWTSIILEILNNYRYILIWIYWSFIWLFLSTIFTISLFTSFTWWYAKHIILVVLLPLTNFITILFKQLFEFLYYIYFKYTSLDQLWDIFYQIELEEKEQLREEEEKNTI